MSAKIQLVRSSTPLEAIPDLISASSAPGVADDSAGSRGAKLRRLSFCEAPFVGRRRRKGTRSNSFGFGVVFVAAFFIGVEEGQGVAAFSQPELSPNANVPGDNWRQDDWRRPIGVDGAVFFPDRDQGVDAALVYDSLAALREETTQLMSLLLRGKGDVETKLEEFCDSDGMVFRFLPDFCRFSRAPREDETSWLDEDKRTKRGNGMKPRTKNSEPNRKLLLEKLHAFIKERHSIK